MLLASVKLLVLLFLATTNRDVVFLWLKALKAPRKMHLRLLHEEFLSKHLQIGLLQILNSDFSHAGWSLVSILQLELTR